MLFQNLKPNYSILKIEFSLRHTNELYWQNENNLPVHLRVDNKQCLLGPKLDAIFE